MTNMRENIKIAIHPRTGSFSDRWIEYCKTNLMQYKTVNCYDSDIIEQVKGFDILLWHWVQHDALAMSVAQKIVGSAENMGVVVFPNKATFWHFDDKVAQKYLLEAINAPLVSSYVFYQKEKALEWAEQTTYPKVFKLKSGAGSANVRLVKSKEEAVGLCLKAFGPGIVSQQGYFGDAKIKLRKIGTFPQFIDKLKRLPKYLLSSVIIQQQMPRERGYIYFQDFMPGNQYDTRITVIGNRAFGYTRNVRPDDFRASGSGLISYDLKRIDMQCVSIAFDVADKIRSQSMAFDFIKDENGKPKLVEISYGFIPKLVYDCAGHWDRDLNWREGHVHPEDAILEDMLFKLK
jgi:glutathione synthase/RimK-type ligase-like ATP-grasp enzyme